MMDMIKNDIKATMDRVLKQYIGSPVNNIIEPLKKDILHTGISVETTPKIKFAYYRCCKCGRFCKINNCKYCGVQDVKSCFNAWHTVPVEIIELNFTI